METKDPFVHKGRSGMVRVGERNLLGSGVAVCCRTIPTGMERNGWLISSISMPNSDDWKAENYDPITDSKVPAIIQVDMTRSIFRR
jgi:hypothetical protein